MNKPIGVIDSGVGGLTVVHELMRQLPKERLIYLGDTIRCPYGPRTPEEIREFTWEMVEFLLTKDIKMLVIACNTATAYTLEELQEKLSIPVVGVIQPGARAAIKSTLNNHVGIIGTVGTIHSNAYGIALNTIKPNLHITSVACPTFVPMVERGVLSGKEAEVTVEDALLPLKQFIEMDTLILGCTHYPLLKDVVQQVVGPQVTLISSSEETARETSTILEINQMFNEQNEPCHHQFYTTGDVEIFTSLTKRIFNSSIDNLKSVSIEKVII
ncbi:glutamate racemase [Ornithinibacillus californiensis]|uniref:glutamate racemase n=1 Tax=Ornithinibacillus californiensis TaxID=161536 RepID=UPI00064D79BC|nr:glutamate racemase [Ornithinibacillus californiensis]